MGVGGKGVNKKWGLEERGWIKNGGWRKGVIDKWGLKERGSVERRWPWSPPLKLLRYHPSVHKKNIGRCGKGITLASYSWRKCAADEERSRGKLAILPIPLKISLFVPLILPDILWYMLANQRKTKDFKYSPANIFLFSHLKLIQVLQESGKF